MPTQVDVVHGAYYLLLWPVVHIFGTGEFVVRFPSALALTAAAYGIGVLGRSSTGAAPPLIQNSQTFN